MDLILVPEKDAWLLALAAPIARRVGDGREAALVLAVSPRSVAAVRTLTRQGGVERAILFGDAASPWEGDVAGPSIERIPLAKHPAESSWLIARRFWKTAPEVVAASTEDDEAIILAATLAAHSNEPLLLVDPGDRTVFSRQVQEFQCKRALLVTAQGPPALDAAAAGCQFELLDRAEAESRTAARLDPAKVRNVVLARTPEDKLGRTAWLAPYVSLARGAPVVLCRSHDAIEAEQWVETFLARHRLRPETLTILADYESIGAALAEIREDRDPDGPRGVVLQNCDSLQRGVLRQVHDNGGVAIVGTSTRVHSTSGSSLIKAMIDAALYRGATLGEALRDAQNYFYCLQDLKDDRDHKEQAKSHRVVLSFRLWGDPELGLFPQDAGRPQRSPIAACWESPDRLAVTLPADPLPEVQNEQYVVRAFPGSETAGMVMRLAGPVSLRRLTPLYFFRLTPPAGFSPRGRRLVENEDHEHGARSVFRVDPMEPYVYVLHYPAADGPGGSVVLRFAEGGP